MGECKKESVVANQGEPVIAYCHVENRAVVRDSALAVRSFGELRGDVEKAREAGNPFWSDRNSS